MKDIEKRLNYYQKVQLTWLYFVLMLRREEDKEKKLAYYMNLRKKRLIKGRNNGLKKRCRNVSKIGKKIGKSKIKCRHVEAEIDEKQLLFNKEFFKKMKRSKKK